MRNTSSFVRPDNLFTQQSQSNEQTPASQIQMKRQSFRKQIRNQKLHEYKNKIRTKLIFKSQENIHLLSKINLNEDLGILATHVFELKAQEICIDQININYDLQNRENQNLKIAINNIFLYATSSMNHHLICLIQQLHIKKLVQAFQLKIIEMKNRFQQINQKENFKSNNLILPIIYQRILVILTQLSFDSTLYYSQPFYVFSQILLKVIQIFPHQTRVIECCMHLIGNFLSNPTIMNDILKKLNDQANQYCILSKILDLFQRFVHLFDSQSYHSTSVMKSILNFYTSLFQTIKITDLYPQMRKRIFQLFYLLLIHKESNEQIFLQIARALFPLYDYNVEQFTEIVFETQNILRQVIQGIYRIITHLKRNEVREAFQITKDLCILYFSIISIVFAKAGSNDKNFQQISQLLNSFVQDRIDNIMQEGLKSKQLFIIRYTLQLTKTICLWGDFISQVYQNPNILNKLFHYSSNLNINIKNQAISCLCNIVQGFFQGKKYFDTQLYQMYEQIIERFDFLQILVQNLDKHTDFQINRDILSCIKILCQFWQTDPQTQKLNRFWIKFIQNGGQLKLNNIITNQRNQELQSIAVEILDLYSIKQIQI